MDSRNGSRQPHAAKSSAGINARQQKHHCDGKDEAAHDAGLNETGVQPPLFGRGMFRDIDRRAAIFPAQGQPLHDPQTDDDDGRRDTDRCRARNQPDPGGRDPHQRYRDQKSVFTPQPVAEETEQDRAQRPKAEAHGEPGPDQQDLQRFIIGWKKRRADQPGQRPVYEKVVPFENGSGRGCCDNQPYLLVGRFGQRMRRLAGPICAIVGGNIVHLSQSPRVDPILLTRVRWQGQRLGRGVPHQHDRAMPSCMRDRGGKQCDIGPMWLRPGTCQPCPQRLPDVPDTLPVPAHCTTREDCGGRLPDGASGHTQTDTIHRAGIGNG